jgi:hypothetical protein
MRFAAFACSVALILLASQAFLEVSAQSDAGNNFSVPGWQNNPYGCSYWWANFNLNAGQEVSVQWTTSGWYPIDLYIATPLAASGRWFCGTGPEALFYDSGALGSTNWVAPATGTYAFVVVNDGLNAASGTLSLSAGNTTITASATGYGNARQLHCPILPLC